MFTRLDEYRHRFKNFTFERRDGILQVTFHTNDGPLLWSSMPDGPQHSAGEMFHAIGHDPENRIVILTGTGDRWCTDYDQNEYPDQSGVTPLWWDHLYRAEHDLLHAMLAVPVPIIAVVPGPCTYHAEIVLLADVVLAAEDTYFADDSHLAVGVVPGDGIQILWSMLVGPNRARAMQYLHQRIDAREALALGIVAELHAREQLLPRAWAIAADLVRRCTPVTLRNTRTVMIDYVRRRVLSEHVGGYALEGLAQVMRPQLAGMPDVDVWKPGHPNSGTIPIGHD